MITASRQTRFKVTQKQSFVLLSTLTCNFPFNVSSALSFWQKQTKVQMPGTDRRTDMMARLQMKENPNSVQGFKTVSRTIHITRNCGENLSPLLEVRKGVQSPSHRLKPHPTPSQDECLGAWNQLNHVRAYPTSLSEELKISSLRGFMIAKTGL